MICSMCGAKIEENGSFCPKCGTSVDLKSKEIDATPKPEVKVEIPSVEEIFPKTEAKVETTDNVVVTSEPDGKVETPSGIVTDLAITDNYSGGSGSIFPKFVAFCVGACAIISIIMILTESYNGYKGYQFLVTTLLVFIFGILNVGYCKLRRVNEDSILALIGMVLSTITISLRILQMWGVLKIESEIVSEIVSSMAVICFGIFHISYILIIDLQNSFARSLANAAKILIAITYSCIVLYVFTNIYDSFFIKVFCVLIILTAFTTIATPLVNYEE